ncbi:MAG: Lrp/AsnC ligand binding domain-containing protein [Flavobacteriaceae bacterium]
MSQGDLKLDGIDKSILNALMKDARISLTAIGREVGISSAAIHQRLKKLEQSGLISGTKLMINPKIIGYKTEAFVGVFLDSSSKYNDAINRLREIPEVTESHYTTGNYAILLKILCRDNEHLMQVLNHQIQKIKGVSRTETFISLEQQISRQIKL